MLPSLAAHHLTDDIVRYITATLAFSDPTYTAAVARTLRDPEHGLFRGPYLRLGLPFASADANADNPLHITPPFVPHAHQLQAFKQLHTGGPHRASNTLVTTGTGSGKTECFLYPVLDHVWRNRHRKGVQAILIYPMNALATDQARRLAQILRDTPELEGIRAGLYVGGDARDSNDGSARLIEDKKALRRDPPQILLTNYKMLDFMLLRPDERSLWAHDGEEHPLSFVVLDELHTFDGAQGSDVACLLRRLKARLRVPEGQLVCAGTSATIGSANNPLTFARLAEFASELFDEPFLVEHVVQEQRTPAADFLEPASGSLPEVADPIAFDQRAHPDLNRWLDDMCERWVGPLPSSDRVALGDALRAHPMLHALLAVANEGPVHLGEIEQRLDLPGWSSLDPRTQRLLLTSFLALVSHARQRSKDRVVPLVTVQVQLWARELNRLLRTLPDLEDGELPEPRFVWWSDVPDEHTPEGHHAPQAHCRECGAHGIAAMQTDRDRERGTLSFGAGAVGQSWMSRGREARFLQLIGGDEQPLARLWLDPRTRALSSTRPVDAEGEPRGVPVIVSAPQPNAKGDRHRFVCPVCDNRDCLSIVGSKAASLLTVAVSHLFQTPVNDDPKLLAFTDAVQDACHRSGFFASRAYRIHLRTALQRVIARQGPFSLADAPRIFREHWTAELGSVRAFTASFLPHDLRELPAYRTFVAKPKRKHASLHALLDRRLAWEFQREFGVASVFGRTLERSGASVAAVDATRLQAASTQFDGWITGEGLHAGVYHPTHFLLGLVRRLRRMGGIHHPYLERGRENYLKTGKRYAITKRNNEEISPLHPRARVPRAISSRGTDAFPSPYGRSAARSWFSNWMDRALNWGDPGDMHRVYSHALQALVDARILREVNTGGGNQVWVIEPSALVLTNDLAALRSEDDLHHVARHEAAIADGKPDFTFRSTATLTATEATPGFYAQVYGRPSTTRVYPAEHTGLLQREDREDIEERFIAGATATDLDAPNLLVCTPTLEMGVDIGDLSAVLLCSVPPAPANYLQRIGRAGRKTGNALVFTMATRAPHDQYFHAEPTRMLAGHVEPPGVYLQAVSMLKRQLLAWCMDDWALRDDNAGPMPRKTSLILSEKGRALFPGPFLTHLEEHGSALITGFLERFGGPLPPQAHDELRAWATSEHGIRAHMHGALDAVQAQIRHYQNDRKKAQKRLEELEGDTTKADELKDTKRYLAVLASLIAELRERYPLNVFTDASLLPNYAFPERGVELHAMLGAREDDKAKKTWDKRAYLRPSARAIRELAPFNIFYAEGHKMEVAQVDLGPRAQRVEHWRICPNCHHSERAIAEDAIAEGPCPRCEHADWSDRGQIRAMLPMSTVRSVSDRVRSTTTDATDEREQRQYNLVTLFELPEDAEGEGTLIPELGFGFEYVERIQLTEMNTGPTQGAEGAPKVQLAGGPASAEGFLTCSDCGTAIPPRGTPSKAHAPYCPQRGKDAKPRYPLYLYRQLESEALRFLLPYAELEVESGRRSFEAALAYGLRRRFRGQPVHLQTYLMSQPSSLDAHIRHQFVVLMDAVPGGTGYLRDYRDRTAVFRLLTDALHGLIACPCDDGCYRCLYAHQASRHLPVLSKTRAIHLLQAILDHQQTAESVPGGFALLRSTGSLESILEARTVSALQARFSSDWMETVRDKRWEFRAGDTLWQLDTQVDTEHWTGTPSRADFVFTGLSGPGQGLTAVLECDGFAFHACPTKEQSRLEQDFRKRQALLQRAGMQVFSLTWSDLGEDPAPLLCTLSVAQWHAVLTKQPNLVPTELRKVATRLLSMNAFELLCAWLQQPDAHWGRLIASLFCMDMVFAVRGGRLVDATSAPALRRHLRGSPHVEPIPPWSTAKPSSRAPTWTVLQSQGPAALMLTASPAAITSPDPTATQALLRLDTQHTVRQDEDYNEAWWRVLATLNLVQFLELELVHELDSAEDTTMDPNVEALFASVGLAPDPVPAPVAASPPVEPLTPSRTAPPPGLVEQHDTDVQQILRDLLAAGAPLPSTDPMSIAGDIGCAIQWTEQRVALVWDEPYRDEYAWAETHGWTLLVHPALINDLRAALGLSET